ncbi:Bacterial mobilization protein (MobC) [compost metagenome]
MDDLVYEVNKIGNNINQIARRANEVEYVSLDDIKYLKKQLEGIYSQIERFYDGG